MISATRDNEKEDSHGIGIQTVGERRGHCPWLERVPPQAPDGIFVAVGTCVGDVVAGLAVTAGLFLTGLFLLPRLMPGEDGTP